MVSRYDGEEFGMLLPETSVEDARTKAEARSAAVEATEVRTGTNDVIRVTVSLGIAAFDPAHPVSRDTLIGAAAGALYQSKCNGRNRITVRSATPIHYEKGVRRVVSLFAIAKRETTRLTPFS